MLVGMAAAAIDPEPIIQGQLFQHVIGLELVEFLRADDVGVRLADRVDEQVPAFRPYVRAVVGRGPRSEEHTSELQSLMRRSYAVFGLKQNRSLPYISHHETQDQ